MGLLRMVVLCGVLIWGSVPGAWAGNVHGTGGEAAERAAWFGDLLSEGIVTGCVPPAPGASLTMTAPPCEAYLRAATGELVYVQQATQAVGPLDAGDGLYWLLLHRNTSSAISGWTREPGTHYLWQKATTQPALPPEALMIARVTVNSSVIQEVVSLGQTGNLGKSVVYSSKFPTIQAAVDSLGPHGGTVMVEPGTHLITSTLTIGTGDVGTVSAKEGIVLECMGQPGRSKTESATVLKYTGTAGLPLIAIKGPLVGWGVKNCYLDGNSLASVDLYVQSARGGDVSNLVMEGHTYAGIHSTCVPTFVGWNGATDSLRNKVYGSWIWHLPPGAPGSAGIVLTSTSSSCNSDFWDFFGTSVLVSGVDGWGIYLGAADHISFFNLHVFDDAMTRSDVHFAYDNSIYTGWPCGITFYGLSLGEKGMSASGTPLVNTCGNTVFGYSGGDPANYIIDLPGVSAVWSDKTTQDLVLTAGRNASNAQTVGNVRIHTDASFPRHMVPSADNLVNLGALGLPSGDKRFKDAYLSGHVVQQSRGVIADTVLLLNDHYLQVANTGGGTVVTLPSAVTACGRTYIVKNTTSNTVTLTPILSQTIDTAATFVLDASPSSAIFISDCLNWSIIATHGTH